ncbi:MAG: hypothetical protein IRZ08_07790 [Frankia sp.]|nr:hypothetical protein [Frankia sp.]
MALSGRSAVGYRIFADVRLIDDCIRHVRERFGRLLTQGAQVTGLPAGTAAAGQYLDQYSFAQRGLFGTAAAVLVLSRSAPDTDRLRMIDALIRYLKERPEIEEGLADPEGLPVVRARLAIEKRDTFKSADVLYALSIAPAAAAGRDLLIGRLLPRITAARCPTGGWAVELDPTARRDPLATAHVLRALHAAGVGIATDEITALRSDLSAGTQVSPYVRCAILFALAQVTPEDRTLAGEWRQLWESLRPEAASRAEANYEYTIGDRQYYVRIPWQLYLLAAATVCRRRALLTSPGVRTILFDCAGAIASSEGFAYRSSGHAQSTRTNAIAVETLWMARQNLRRSPALAACCLAVNSFARVFQSRVVSFLLWIVGLGLAVTAAVLWLIDSNGQISALGPEMVGVAVLALAGASLRRIRR